MNRVTVSEARAADAPFLADMLLAAASWDAGRPPIGEAALRTTHELWHYVEGWPRGGDVGVVAKVDEATVGAAWLRYFAADDPGYGFTAADVPELTIGVAAEWRGRGVGGALLDGLLEAARMRGIARVSLSVEPANRAADLYRRHGFRAVGMNGGSLTMVADLPDS